MKKAIILLLPFLFTAQACNFLFGDLTGDQGSGSRGVYLSTDSGQTWQEMNKVGKTKALSGYKVQQIVMDRNDPKNIIAVTSDGGLLASATGGQAWFVLLPDFSGYDAFINPANSKEIFAAGSRGGLSGILKSSDTGTTWVQTYSEPTGRAAVTSLVYNPSISAVFFAGLSTGTVLKSQDSGNNWNILTDFRDRIVKLALTPDGKTIYVLGRAQGLHRSQDGGKTWTGLALSGNSIQYNDFFLEPGNSAVLYLATDKGLWRSADTGGHWNQLSLPVTPEVSNISALVVNPQNARQIFATIKTTVYRSDDYGASWRTEILPTRRTISKIAINPAEPNRIYVGLR